MDVEQGDVVEVMSNKVGTPNRRGVVKRVLSREPAHIEVEWDDGHTSEFVPSMGNCQVVGRAE